MTDFFKLVMIMKKTNKFMLFELVEKITSTKICQKRMVVKSFYLPQILKALTIKLLSGCYDLVISCYLLLSVLFPDIESVISLLINSVGEYFVVLV